MAGFGSLDMNEVTRIINAIQQGDGQATEELLPLVKLRGIGRVRARMLYNNGFRKIADLRKASLQQIERVIGSKVAESVKKQV